MESGRYSFMTSIDEMRSGGRKLRELREAQQMTQMDIERATMLRYGSENRIYAQQVSRIEKGQVDKPPILDLLRIGEVLGLDSDDIAEMFGLWQRQSGKGPRLDPRIREVIALSQEAPDDVREELLAQLEVVVALTRAKLRKRMNEQGE